MGGSLMTAKLPEHFEANNYTIKVKLLKKIKSDKKKEKLRGEFDPNKYIIRVEKSIPDKEWHDLIHEFLHLSCDLVELSNPDAKNTAKEVDKDETFIDALAGLIHQFIKPYLRD